MRERVFTSPSAGLTTEADALDRAAAAPGFPLTASCRGAGVPGGQFRVAVPARFEGIAEATLARGAGLP